MNKNWATDLTFFCEQVLKLLGGNNGRKLKSTRRRLHGSMSSLPSSIVSATRPRDKRKPGTAVLDDRLRRAATTRDGGKVCDMDTALDSLTTGLFKVALYYMTLRLTVLTNEYFMIIRLNVLQYNIVGCIVILVYVLMIKIYIYKYYLLTENYNL